MSRCLLHKSKMHEFKTWLEREGFAHRGGRGLYQALQVWDGSNWLVVYERNNMPEHYTVDRRLEGLVRKYIEWRKGNDFN